MRLDDNIVEWKERLLSGDINALAKAITLIESHRESDQETKIRLLQSIQSIRKTSVKIGITGNPGVGKSTFLNSFVSLFHNSSHKIAILTIDPSSEQTGGSLLGDKLRMEDLIHMKQVYIRPSPSKGVLGGINLTTWETIQICEAAGYDYIFIETVGIGQSEVEVQYLVNEIWYLTMTRLGDEIQGIKRGILEVVDRIIVTKKDLDPIGTQKTRALLKQSLKTQTSDQESIRLYEVSAFQPDTLRSLFVDMQKISAESLTQVQQTYWVDRGWKEMLIHFIESDKHLIQMRQELTDQIFKGKSDYWTAMIEIKNELEKKWRK